MCIQTWLKQMAENEDFSYGSRKTVKRSRQTHTHSLKSNWILQKFLFVFATVGKTKRVETLLNPTRAKKRVIMEGEDNNKKKETVNESSRERHYNTYRYFTLLIEEIKKCTTVVVAIVFCGC